MVISNCSNWSVHFGCEIVFLLFYCQNCTYYWHGNVNVYPLCQQSPDIFLSVTEHKYKCNCAHLTGQTVGKNNSLINWPLQPASEQVVSKWCQLSCRSKHLNDSPSSLTHLASPAPCSYFQTNLPPANSVNNLQELLWVCQLIQPALFSRHTQSQLLSWSVSQ